MQPLVYVNWLCLNCAWLALGIDPDKLTIGAELILMELSWLGWNELRTMLLDLRYF